MDKRTLLTSLWVVPLVSTALLLFVWRLSCPPPGKESAPPPSRGFPPKVTFPPGFFRGLKKVPKPTPFRWIAVYRGGPASRESWKKALESYDLVLSAQTRHSSRPWVEWGSRWGQEGPKGPGGEGVFHLAWLGPATPRLRACLVRVLEVLVSTFSLPVEAVRLREELPWASSSRGRRGKTSSLEGERIRSWIRGAGAGQGGKGR